MKSGKAVESNSEFGDISNGKEGEKEGNKKRDLKIGHEVWRHGWKVELADVIYIYISEYLNQRVFYSRRK